MGTSNILFTPLTVKAANGNTYLTPIRCYSYWELNAFISCTAIAGATTLDAAIETYDDYTGLWWVLANFTQIVAAPALEMRLVLAGLGENVAVRWVFTGAGPATFSISGVLKG